MSGSRNIRLAQQLLPYREPRGIQNRAHPSDDAARAYLEDLLSHLDESAVLSSNDWRLVVRGQWVDGQPVVIKLWARPDVKGRFRRLFRVSSAHYEWDNLQLLHRVGVRVPTPIEVVILDRNARGYRYTEALVMEDLGPCDTAIGYLKRCIQTEDRMAQKALESALIEMTAGMVKAKLLDWDHSLVNMVISPSAGPARLDLEQARRVRTLRANYSLYGRMLGRLLGSYAFAVQPDIRQAVCFSRQLFRKVLPSARVVRFAQSEVDAMLSRQFDEIGLESKFSLPADYLHGGVK